MGRMEKMFRILDVSDVFFRIRIYGMGKMVRILDVSDDYEAPLSILAFF
jgi:hypothetical protein